MQDGAVCAARAPHTRMVHPELCLPSRAHRCRHAVWPKQRPQTAWPPVQRCQPRCGGSELISIIQLSFILLHLRSFFTVPKRLCRKVTCSGGGEQAELIGDMKGHVHWEIPLFREQTAAEIDFFPCLLEFLPPAQSKKGLALQLPALECQCNLLDAFIINRDRKLFPITRYFLPFFPFALILSSFLGFLSEGPGHRSAESRSIQC